MIIWVYGLVEFGNFQKFILNITTNSDSYFGSVHKANLATDNSS